ncbi:MAG: BACON domain-containing protein, partial [Candidatus Aminicenantes bacterium]
YYEDFNQAFQEVDASQNQWSIGGETWWFPHHNGQAPQVQDSFLVLYSEKNESDSTFIKQEAQTLKEFFLPDEGELIIGLWSDRWAKYPSLPDDYWVDSSVGLEIYKESHDAVVFVYGHLGVFDDPTGDCDDHDKCKYEQVEGWEDIAATDTPIAVRIAWTTEGGNKTFNLYIITEDSEDTEPRATIPDVGYIGSDALRIRLNANVAVSNKAPIDSDTLKIDYICLRSSAAQGSPGISLNRQQFYFGVSMTNPLAGPQALLINNTGEGTLNWAAVPSAGWVQVYPASGTGNGEVSISVDGTGLAPGTYTGTITVSDANAFNSPQSAAVTLTVYQANASAPPFGEFSTPIDGSPVSSSIPVTGWALDDIGIENIKIYRGESNNLVFIGDAVLVEGARPDVEQAYPGYPMNHKAGWGYMMLTNFLPGGGNGTFKIHAIATDAEGHQVTLGTKTILCDNANAVKPFGAIDTPGQGGMASGNRFVNWGWVLTQQPNRIPTDGSTLYVFMDGVNLGHPTYNIYRADIANLFTGYANSEGAAGYFYLDTTLYENGVHTIQWTAADNAGNTDGIGSRYFNIHNTGGAWVKSKTFNRKKVNNNREYYPISQISDLPVDDSHPIIVRRGLEDYRRGCHLETDENGVYNIRIKELEPIAVDFPGDITLIAGYTLVGKELRSLPIGSTFDWEAGKFYWQPGPGFIGEYRFVFI